MILKIPVSVSTETVPYGWLVNVSNTPSFKLPGHKLQTKVLNICAWSTCLSNTLAFAPVSEIYRRACFLVKILRTNFTTYTAGTENVDLPTCSNRVVE